MTHIYLPYFQTIDFLYFPYFFLSRLDCFQHYLKVRTAKFCKGSSFAGNGIGPPQLHENSSSPSLHSPSSLRPHVPVQTPSPHCVVSSTAGNRTLNPGTRVRRHTRLSRLHEACSSPPFLGSFLIILLFLFKNTNEKPSKQTLFKQKRSLKMCPNTIIFGQTCPLRPRLYAL